MNQDYTYIAEVLDRSGSMHSVADGTMTGHNEFLQGQKAAPGKADFLLVQFDHEYQVVYDGPIADAPELTVLNFTPRGQTGLLDAIGKTVYGLGKKLAAMPEDDRPAKVVIVIITDGHENASHEWTRDKVFQLINLQQEKYKWQFIFLGANQDAISAGTNLGVNAANSMSYSASDAGTRNTYYAAGQSVTRLRHMNVNSGVSGQSMSATMGFSDEEREKAMEEKPKDKAPKGRTK